MHTNSLCGRVVAKWYRASRLFSTTNYVWKYSPNPRNPLKGLRCPTFDRYLLSKVGFGKGFGLVLTIEISPETTTSIVPNVRHQVIWVAVMRRSTFPTVQIATICRSNVSRLHQSSPDCSESGSLLTVVPFCLRKSQANLLV